MRRSSVLWLMALCLVGLASKTALAEPKDKAALQLDQQAIQDDYLATRFSDAETRLQQAVALCGASMCSAQVRARVHRNLGILYLIGMNRPEEARAHLMVAIRVDPTITLERELSTPELVKLFAELKGTPEGAAAPKTGEAPALPTPASPPAAVENGIVHTPPVEQAVLTPVPIFAELADGVTAARVQLRYKPFGATEWKILELRKLKNGYGAEIPCLEVGSAAGNLDYYVQAFDANGGVVATSGSQTAPHRVPIRTELSGDAPHLPGKPAPAQCADSRDCPPGLPGCATDKPDRGAGDGASATATCESPTDCAPGEDCGAGGRCEKPTVPAKENWFTVALQQDFVLLPSSSGACSASSDFSCFYSDQSYYQDTPWDGAGNQVGGGLSVATTRILLGYNRALTDKLTLGGRLGYALGGGPTASTGKSFFPVHAEVRGAYFFGHGALQRKGLRPFLVLAGGIAQIDAKVLVTTYTDQQAYNRNDETKLTAWKKAGFGFAAAGAGVVLALTPSSGLLVEAKIVEMIGSDATGANVQLGYTVGL